MQNQGKGGRSAEERGEEAEEIFPGKLFKKKGFGLFLRNICRNCAILKKWGKGKRGRDSLLDIPPCLR